MKKIYNKPSMAVNSFDTSDCTNVNIASSVGVKAGDTTYSRLGVNIIDRSNLKS